MSLNISSKGQKVEIQNIKMGLDEALRAIKAKSGQLSSNSSQKVSHLAAPLAAQNNHQQQKPQSVFGNIEDEEDQEDNVVQHVPQGVSGSQKREYSFRGPKNNRGFTSSSYIQDENNTNHSRLHKPGHQYFGDKLERLQRSEEESKNKLQSDLELQNCRQELKKVKEMIIEEKLKVFICKPCKRKFPNIDILEKHELQSESHKKICTQQK